MIQTAIFRLYPTPMQEKKLGTIFTVYNRVKRIGYNLLFDLKDMDYTKTEKRKIIQPKLMEICKNNPYVNTILIHNEMKVEQQQTWYKKRGKYMKLQIDTIQDKINQIRANDRKDRRLKGLYSRLSSIQNKLNNLKLKSVVFGTKSLFRQRILGKISREEFRIRRDSSFCCIGKKQGINLNLKILSNEAIWIRTFSKVKGKKWLLIPLSVNQRQTKCFNEIFEVEKYTVTIKRRIVKGEVRYFTHVSYEIPESEMRYDFNNGAVGLDFNYNFVSLSNIDQNGLFKSYHEISFRNMHTLRKNRRLDYISYKMDKVVNYCINKKKGVVIEDLSFVQKFSYNKTLNRKLSNFKIKALELLENKCIKKGVALRKVHPAYTSLIGKYKYSRSLNLSTHILASYVIARRGMGFKEIFPPIYKWLLSQVGDNIKLRLKKGSPYSKWSQIHDFFKHSGITSFKAPDVMKKTLQMKYALYPATGVQPDNLRAGLSPSGKIEDYHKFWNFIEFSNFL
ncbi:MAG: IS200/IS605 family accessory protein TnpB-related protein [Promethearchaeota archaeon]